MDAYVRRIDGDIQSHKARVTTTSSTTWHLFVEEWTTFRDGAGWFARTTGATSDKALDYRKRADAWDELIAGAAPQRCAQAKEAAPAADKGRDAMNAFLMTRRGIGIAAYVSVKTCIGPSGIPEETK